MRVEEEVLRDHVRMCRTCAPVRYSTAEKRRKIEERMEALDRSGVCVKYRSQDSAP
jgi:hypothetical protein